MDTPPALAQTPPAYQDRGTGLMIFGVLEIIFGCLCALMLPLTLFGQMMAARKSGHDFDFALVVPALLTFLTIAVGFIWLGIGSIYARRWSRALLLCLGWMGLCVGVISIAMIIPTLGSMEEIMRQQGREMPPMAIALAKMITVGTIFVMYVLIPGALVLFYRSRHVKLTCEHRDPVERWTDRCPLPVLAICLLQAWGAVYVLLMPRFGGAMPLAGFLVTGWPARLLWFGFTGLSLYAAWGFYRLNYRTWLIYTVVLLVFGVSSVVTFTRIGLMDYYRAAGLPERQLQMLAHSPLVRGNSIIWMSALSLVLFGGYLLYLRRYFVAARDRFAPA